MKDVMIPVLCKRRGSLFAVRRPNLKEEAREDK